MFAHRGWQQVADKLSQQQLLAVAAQLARFVEELDTMRAAREQGGCVDDSTRHELLTQFRKWVDRDELPELLWRRENVLGHLRQIQASLSLVDAANLIDVSNWKTPVSRLRETAEWLMQVAGQIRSSSLTEALANSIDVLETQGGTAVTGHYWESVEWLNVTVINELAQAEQMGPIFDVNHASDGSRTLIIHSRTAEPAVRFLVLSPKTLESRPGAGFSSLKGERAIKLLHQWLLYAHNGHPPGKPGIQQVSPVSLDPPDENVFQREGAVWHFTFAGTSAVAGDLRGLHYLSQLLREPGRNISAIDLSANRSGIDPRSINGSDGELIDDEAKRDYRRRSEELQHELAVAEANHDFGNIEKLQEELNALTTELARATGLGGRLREKSDVQRVRKSVSMAVSRATDRITEVHQSLGKHLNAFVIPGTVFRYEPDPAINWLT